MGKTFYEEKAEELLAKRGEQERPRSLGVDLAEWLETERASGYLAGLDFAERRMRDFRRDMANMEGVLREAVKAGARCPFMTESGKRCTSHLQHEGLHHVDEATHTCNFQFSSGKPCVSPTCHLDGKHYTEGVVP